MNGSYSSLDYLCFKGIVQCPLHRYMDSGFGRIGWQLDKIDVYSLGVCICDLCMGYDASQFSQDLEKARGDGIPGLSRPLQNLIKVESVGISTYTS